ncbi:LacI family DNA-binding transcriptional regulator [Caulobacter segnis]
MERGGRRRATINDIARLAGVSKKTVSRVINQSPFCVRDETRERIEAVIAEGRLARSAGERPGVLVARS